MKRRDKPRFHGKRKTRCGGFFGKIREAAWHVAEWLYSANMFVITTFFFCDDDEVEGYGPTWYAAMAIVGWIVAFSAVLVSVFCMALVVYASFAFYEIVLPFATVFILFWFVKLSHKCRQGEKHEKYN